MGFFARMYLLIYPSRLKITCCIKKCSWDNNKKKKIKTNTTQSVKFSIKHFFFKFITQKYMNLCIIYVPFLSWLNSTWLHLRWKIKFIINYYLYLDRIDDLAHGHLNCQDCKIHIVVDCLKNKFKNIFHRFSLHIATYFPQSIRLN